MGEGVSVNVAVGAGVGVKVGGAVAVGEAGFGGCVAVAVDVGVAAGGTALNSTRVSTLGFSSTSKVAFNPNGSTIYLPGVRPVNSTVLGPNSLGFWPVLAVLIT